MNNHLRLFFLLSLVVVTYLPPQTGLSKKKDKPTPLSTSDFFSEEDNGELEEMTDRSIEELQKLIRRFSQSKNRGELWLRLAELYVEKSRLIEAKAFKKFDKDVENFKGDKSQENPEVDVGDAKEFNKKAVELYERFVRDFPEDPKIDQALFFLGFNYFALDIAQKGAIFYRQLTQNHPGSPYVSESNFALGEYHFDRDEWAVAKEYYLKVAEDKKARLYLFSLYKAAWCDYRVGEGDIALASMERVLNESRSNRQETEVAGRKRLNRLRLTSEALHDIVPFYAESKQGYQSAYEYMRRIAGGKLAFSLVEKLAYYYSDTGQKEAARHCFRELIEERPLAPKAFDYQYQIVNHYVFSTKDSVLKTELMRWIDDFGPKGAWHRANAENVQLVKDAEKVRESTLRNYVLQMHQTAKNSRQATSENAAWEGYVLYIKSFPDSAQLDLMQFYFGELLFDMKKYDLAAKQYAWIIKNRPKSSYAEPAVINSTIAFEKALPSEKEMKERMGSTTKPVPFSAEIKKFEQSAIQYTTQFPNGEKRSLVTFKMARLHYIHNHLDEALAGFKEVVKLDPKSKLGEYAANLVLDIYNIKKDYSGLQAAGKEMLKEGISDKAEGEIQGIIEKSSFKTAQDLESNKQYISSAKGYLAFAEQNPASPLAMSALFNAAVNFDRAGDVLSATRFFSLFSQKYKGKDKKLESDANERLAKIYVDTAQYQKAAKQYKKLAAMYPQSPMVVGWVFNAAVIWDDLGFWDLALRDYKLYYALEKKKEKEEAWFRIGEMLRRRGAKRDALAAYEKYLSLSPSSAEHVFLATFHAGELYEKQGLWTEAKKRFGRVLVLDQTLKSRQIKDREELVAESSFQLALEKYRTFLAIKFPKLEKAQQKALADKLKALEDLKKEMAKIIEVKQGEQVVSSLVTLGRSHWHMYSFFRKIPIPKSLAEAQKKEYKKQLFLQTKPFRESAAQYYKEAISFSSKSESYGPWTTVAREENATLTGTTAAYYAEVVEGSAQVDWMSP